MTNAYAGWNLILREALRATSGRIPPSPPHPAPPTSNTGEFAPRSDRRHAFWADGEEFVVGVRRRWLTAGWATVEKPVDGVWTDLDYDHMPYFRDFYPVGTRVGTVNAEARLDSSGVLHCVVTFNTYADSYDYGEGLRARTWSNICYYTFNTNTELWETRELVYTFPSYTFVGFSNCDPHPAISLDSVGVPFIALAWSEQMYNGNSYVYVFKRTGVNTWSQETAITSANGTGGGVMSDILYLPLNRVEIDHDTEDNLHFMAYSPHYWISGIFWPTGQPYLYDRIFYNKRLSDGTYQGQSSSRLYEWEGDPAHEAYDATRYYGINDGECSEDGTYHNVHVLRARLPYPPPSDYETHIVHRWIDRYGNWNVGETVLSPGFFPDAQGVGDSSIAIVPYGGTYKIKLIYHLAEGTSTWHRYYTEKIGAIGAWNTPTEIGTGPYTTYLYKGSVDWTDGTQLDLCLWSEQTPGIGHYTGEQYVYQYPAS